MSTPMATPAAPAEMRAYIIERLVGETGEPGRVTDAARGLIERAVPAIRDALKQNLALDLAVEPASVELSRMADAKPDGEGHAMMVAASPASPDALVLTMDPDAVALIVSALFGGDPGIAIIPISRDLSPTETVVASRVFEEIAEGAAALPATSRSIRAAAAASDQRRRAEEAHTARRAGRTHRARHLHRRHGVGRIVLTMPQRLLLKGAGADGSQKAGPAGQWRQRFSEEVMRSGVELRATMPLAQHDARPDHRAACSARSSSSKATRNRRRSCRRARRPCSSAEFGKLGQKLHGPR